MTVKLLYSLAEKTVVKLLIIHAHPSVKSKWIEPLRNQGWGVMCVSSTQEADQVLQFHGRSLDGVVLHREQAGVSPEAAISWFEQFKQKKDFHAVPTAIVSAVWGERDFLKHQNSTHSANFYLADTADMQELKAKLEGFVAKSATKQAVGQNVNSGQKVSLEDVSVVLARPEVTSTYNALPRESITLAAPGILLGGKSAAEAMKPEAGRIQETAMAASRSDSTVIISTEIEPVEGISFDVDEKLAELQTQSQHPIIEEYVPVQEIQNITNAPLVSGTPSSDVDTLKNYLSMREQDVAVLTGHVRSAQERIHQLEIQLKIEKARGAELQHSLQRQEQVVKNYDLEKKVELEVYSKQIEDLNVQLREKTDKIRLTETKLKYALEEVGKIKERVRVDLRRIRVREKDLESQLEILKKDSSALLIARDEKITELKRKIDLLEFNMELVQEQYSKERSSSEQLRQRLKDASTAMKQAGGFLDHEN